MKSTNFNNKLTLNSNMLNLREFINWINNIKLQIIQKASQKNIIKRKRNKNYKLKKNNRQVLQKLQKIQVKIKKWTLVKSIFYKIYQKIWIIQMKELLI